MYKLFFKGTFLTFGWIILMANLMLTFGLVQNLSDGFGLPTVDYDYTIPKYFGFSSLISIFMGDDFLNSNVVLTPTRNYVTQMYQLAQNLLTPDEVTASHWANINNPIDVFNAIGKTLTDVVKALGAFWVYLWGIICNIVWIAMVVINIFYVVLGMIFGRYAKNVPNTYGNISESAMIIGKYLINFM